MTCPHCSTVVKFDWYRTSAMEIDEDGNGTEISYTTCPNCDKIVIYLQGGYLVPSSSGLHIDEKDWRKLIYPAKSNFSNSVDIPALYLEDYNESQNVLAASPKASAALSRRLLQNILREEFGIKEKSLSTEIQKFIEMPGIPSHLIDAVDAIRNIGNFAAHPQKDLSTGEIVSVEKGEAEWLIEVIEGLFDFRFIQPKKLERKRAELNLKLTKIGKPPMK